MATVDVPEFLEIYHTDKVAAVQYFQELVSSLNQICDLIPFVLDDLEDVTITNPLDGQILGLENGIWRNDFISVFQAIEDASGFAERVFMPGTLYKVLIHELQFATDGLYSIWIHVVAYTSMGNKVRLDLRMQSDESGSFKDVPGAHDTEWTDKVVGESSASLQFSGFLHPATAGGKIRFQIFEDNVLVPDQDIVAEEIRITVTKVN